MSASYSPLRNNNNTSNALEMNPALRIKPNNTVDTSPLLLNTTAPLAKSEIDDDIDNREVVTRPYPGVDDGFFNGSDKTKENHPVVANVDSSHPEVEVISTKPKDPEPIEPPDEIPTIFDRFDPVGGGDDIDGKSNDPKIENRDDRTDEKHNPNEPPHSHSHRPYFPGSGHDFEIGSLPGEIPESIPDVNLYQHKKTLAQGMMDLALFSANANQLRYVLESFNRHPYFYPSIIFISISLILQVAVGMGLIWNARYNVKDDREICIANKISNFTIIGIFLITVINVFISAFGVANPQ